MPFKLLLKPLFPILSALLPLSHANSLPKPIDDLMREPECQGQKPTGTIKFNDEFFAEIESGKKVATTRLGVRCFATNSKVDMQSLAGKVVGTIKIVRVSKIQFDDLTDAHAKKENATLKELQEGLLEIYGPEVKSKPLSFVEFTLNSTK